MYDNFGALVDTNISNGQYYEIPNSASVQQSYRQQLRMMLLAYCAGTTYQAVEQIGQAYTGISPLIIDDLDAYPGWVLGEHSGSLVAVGSDFVVLNTPLPHYGTVVPVTASVGVVGSGYSVSYSKLGNNCIVRDSSQVYSTLDLIIYCPSSTWSTIQSSMTQALSNVVRADTQLRLFQSSNYVTWYPGTTQASGSFAMYVPSTYYISGSVGNTFLVNSISLPVGDTIYGDVLPIVPQAGMNWYYDWSSLLFNNTTEVFGVRTYPTASIPNTVYFQDFDSTPVPLLTQPPGSVGCHWTFDSGIYASESWSTGYSLPVTTSSSLPPLPIVAREDTRTGVAIGLFNSSKHLSYSASVGSNINFTTQFSGEMWVRGWDMWAPSSATIRMRRQASGVSMYGSLTSLGYQFVLDQATDNATLQIYSGGVLYAVSASIAPYLAEDTGRYHYFAFTYNAGSVVIYADGNVAGSGSMAYKGTPILSGNNTTAIVVDSAGILPSYSVGIDEATLFSGMMMPETAMSRFLTTKPHLKRLGISYTASVVYHQPKWTVFASGSSEYELHQFSLRGLSYPMRYILGNSKPIREIPLVRTS
jgi:hypothetical protein